MLRRVAPVFAVLAAALLLAPGALAGGARYVVGGGTAAERAQVRSALQASAFPWGVLPRPVVVHIARGATDEAVPGAVWLDADLLDAGATSWAVVQHEFAHQVDLLLLRPEQRAALTALLGGSAWWDDGRLGHGDYTAERFASTLAWAYWPSPENLLEPVSAEDEAGHVPAAAFRAVLARLLPQVAGAKVRLTLRR